MTSARKQEKVPTADGDQNLRIKEPLSSTKAKEQENTDIPKRIHKYPSSRQIYRADSKDSYLLVFMSLTGLDLVWTRLSDLTSDQQNTTKVMVRLKNGDFSVRLLCLHASLDQASMSERPLGQGSEASLVPIDGTKQTFRITICQELNPANNYVYLKVDPSPVGPWDD